MVGREGIEPPQSKTADLQSAELTTCSTYPRCCCAPPEPSLRGEEGFERSSSSVGADDGTRTRNRRFTKPLLYQLSYVGGDGEGYRTSRRMRNDAPVSRAAGRPPSACTALTPRSPAWRPRASRRAASGVGGRLRDGRSGVGRGGRTSAVPVEGAALRGTCRRAASGSPRPPGPEPFAGSSRATPSLRASPDPGARQAQRRSDPSRPSGSRLGSGRRSACLDRGRSRRSGRPHRAVGPPRQLRRPLRASGDGGRRRPSGLGRPARRAAGRPPRTAAPTRDGRVQRPDLAAHRDAHRRDRAPPDRPRDAVPLAAHDQRQRPAQVRVAIGERRALVRADEPQARRSAGRRAPPARSSSGHQQQVLDGARRRLDRGRADGRRTARREEHPMHAARLGGAQHRAHVLGILERVEHEHEGRLAALAGAREDVVDGRPASRLHDQRDPLVAVEAGERRERAAFDLDDGDAQRGRMQHELLQRLAPVRHHQQATRGATRGEGLLHRPAAGDQLLVVASTRGAGRDSAERRTDAAEAAPTRRPPVAAARAGRSGVGRRSAIRGAAGGPARARARGAGLVGRAALAGAVATGPARAVAGPGAPSTAAARGARPRRSAWPDTSRRGAPPARAVAAAAAAVGVGQAPAARGRRRRSRARPPGRPGAVARSPPASGRVRRGRLAAGPVAPRTRAVAGSAGPGPVARPHWPSPGPVGAGRPASAGTAWPAGTRRPGPGARRPAWTIGSPPGRGRRGRVAGRSGAGPRCRSLGRGRRGRSSSRRGHRRPPSRRQRWPSWRVLDRDVEGCQLRAQRVRPRPVARPRVPPRRSSSSRSPPADSVVSSSSATASTRSRSSRKAAAVRRVGGRQRALGDAPVELAHQVEDGRQRGRDVEVVVQGRLERVAGAREQGRAASRRRPLLAVGVAARRAPWTAAPRRPWPPPATPR